MPPASDGGRAGFSLVEALVVLAITALLLTLTFSVGTGARRAAFSLARRANEGADATIGAESLRSLLQGIRLPQGNRWPVSFAGTENTLVAFVVPRRATVCPVAGGAPLQLRIKVAGKTSRLVCETTDGRASEVMDLGPGRARFSYALAGRGWTDRLTAQPPRASTTDLPDQTLWIRLSTGDGREVLEAVDPPPAPRATGA